MVYLLQTYFGRDGREEAEDLLRRRSGNADNPRILGTFNEPVKDWLSFFMFTTFTDRDGKFQLLALAESGFDPLSRTCRFMLTEEAHHMFVGETGVGRIIQRTAEVMNRVGTDVAKVRAEHAIDLADDPEVPEPLVLVLARPLRRRALEQRRRVLRRRASRAATARSSTPTTSRSRAHYDAARARRRQARRTSRSRCATR